jgi:replicative DNA helicase
MSAAALKIALLAKIVAEAAVRVRMIAAKEATAANEAIEAHVKAALEIADRAPAEIAGSKARPKSTSKN